MKYTWEKDDVCAGRIVRGADAVDKYIIGYNDWTHPVIGRDTRWCLIALSDGCIILEKQTKDDLAKKLNDHNDIPVDVWINGRQLS